MADKKEVVLQALKEAGKPLKSSEIAAMTGIPSKEVTQIIKELKKEGKIVSPKRCYYAPA